MIPRHRLYAGSRVRSLRDQRGLKQADMAAMLGISTSYLSQIEHDDRPLTPALLDQLARVFPLEWQPVAPDQLTGRIAALTEALADRVVPGPAIPVEMVHRFAEQQPDLADRMVALHGAYRRAQEQAQIHDDALMTGVSGVVGAARLPWEEVRDWFHLAGNYVDPLDRAAELLSRQLTEGEMVPEATLIHRLANRHGIHVTNAPASAPLRQFQRQARELRLNAALPPESRRFVLAHQLAALEMASIMGEIAWTSPGLSDEARTLLRVGLANYAAGAILMPYGRYRERAGALRHDIDALCQQFGVSFEQACHRLSTLQRPGERGVPFFFCRVDMAGNITKRHSATRLQFARFGGACPLWIVHEAVAIPDRILVQLAEMPDGVHYVSMAKGLVKPSGSFTRAPRRYAVALGCEVEQAHQFVYADHIGADDRGSSGRPTPIGISCRLCPRDECDQRAFPPADRPTTVDPDVRDVVPYRLG
jgi:predicted transcriptional regulator/transcriptional regulator with XRE-family HTH domain